MNKLDNLTTKATKNILITYSKKKYYIRRPNLNLYNFINNKKGTGLNFIISGRLRGVQRARSQNFSKGVIKFNSLSHTFQAKQFPVQTKWGKFGIKLCLP